MSSTVLTELYKATESGHEFQWSPQIIGNGAGGVICFLLAWSLFQFVSKDPGPEATSRGWVVRRSGKRLSWFGAGRAWDRALAWKDFHFIAGGWGGVVIRSLLYLGLYGLCVGANSGAFWDWSGTYSYQSTFRWDEVTLGFLFFSHPLLAVEIALVASTVFQEEIKRQTLSSLLMLPRSIADVVYSKVCGCSLALFPGIVANVGGILLLPGGSKIVTDVFDEPGFWWWIANLILFVHLTVVLSLFLRWGSFAMSFGITAGMMFLMAMMMSAFAIAGGVRDPREMLTILSVGMLLACMACHAIILFRLPKLGEK